MNSDRELYEHAEALHSEFQRPEFVALRIELEKYKNDAEVFLSKIDITDEKQRAVYLKYQGKLELIELWLSLPETTQNFLQKYAGSIKQFLRI